MIIVQTTIVVKCIVCLMFIIMITAAVVAKKRRISMRFHFLPRWNLRSCNFGLSSPVDGDGGADSKVGNNHHTGVEEDKGLRCNL